MLADVKWHIHSLGIQGIYHLWLTWYLTSMLWSIDSCQKNKSICWPVSPDCIAGSGRQLIEMTYFLKLSAVSSWFSGPFLKGGIQYASCLWRKLDNLRKKLLKRSSRELRFWPWLNLFTMWGIFFEKLSKDGFPLLRNVYVRTPVKFKGENSTEAIESFRF